MSLLSSICRRSVVSVAVALVVAGAAAAAPLVPRETPRPVAKGAAWTPGATAVRVVDLVGPVVVAPLTATVTTPGQVGGATGPGDVGPGDAGPGDAATPNAAAGALVASYGGIWSTGFTPSDTTLALGPDHLVQAVNSSLAVLTRSGSVVFGPHSLSSFFATLLPGGGRSPILFEPQLVFSPVHEKFVLLTASLNRITQESYFFLAISQTADPTGTWWLYRFANGFPHDDVWLGEPSLVVDAFGVYLTGNRYRWTDDAFVDASLWTLGPALMAGELPAPWVWSDLRWDDGTRVAHLRGAVAHSISGEAASYFVASHPAGGDRLRLLRLSGDRGGVPELAASEATVPPYRPLGRRVDQPGTDQDLDGGTSAVAAAVYVQRHVVLTFVSDPTGAGRSSVVRLASLDTADGAVRWRSELAGGDGWYYFVPGLTVTSGDDAAAPVALVFGVVERDALHPSIGAAVLRRDGPDVLRLVKRGESPFAGSSVLWGARSTAVWDWYRPGIVWGSAQYAGAPGVWRTENFAFAAAGETRAAGPPPCLPSATVACFQDGRFAVGIEVGDRVGAGPRRAARLVPGGTDASALFWFFSPANWEALVKVLDGCAIDGHHWVLAAASTAEAHELWVQDLESGVAASYPHAGRAAAPARIDTATFTCD